MTDPRAPEGDFEYDEAHEHTAAEPPAAAHHDAVQVATEAEDAGGADYGYDLSHDVPRTR